MKHLDGLARFGYLARAVVYLLVGGSALLFFLGRPEGSETNQKGALRQLLDQPFGELLLFILAIGLFSYATWRLIQSIMDYEHHGRDLKGMVLRVGYFLGGISHALLGLYALNLIYSISSTSSGGERGVAQWLLSQPFGAFLTAAVGITMIGFGISQFVVAIKEKFARHLEVPREKCSVVFAVCKFGLISRGIVSGVIGYFFSSLIFLIHISQPT